MDQRKGKQGVSYSKLRGTITPKWKLFDLLNFFLGGKGVAKLPKKKVQKRFLIYHFIHVYTVLYTVTVYILYL